MIGWIGIDLDGTLAEYNGPSQFIGMPIRPMLALVKDLLKKGNNIRILTARVSSKVDAFNRAFQVNAISDWCEKWIGQKLPITSEKDYEMLCMFDDRAITVECNTGRILTNAK